MSAEALFPRLDPEAFRSQAHQLADWMADYLRDLGHYRVQPTVTPGEIRGRIPPGPPEQGEAFERIMEDFERIIVPGLTHWGHPGFFGYFPANTSPASILAEMLTAALGAQCMSWNTSPAATELEQAMMEWLRRMLGLPEGFTGVIQDTASTATLVALITARDQAVRRSSGRAVDALTVYTSEEANSSVPKGARLAGIRPDHIRLIPTDAAAAMSVPALEAAIAADRVAGLVPCGVVSTVGTTGSTAIDPVRAIAEVCRREDLWLHVDAAFAGSAAILPEMRWILDGAEHADSLVFNPHKWLLVNFDCSAYFVRDPAALLRSFSASAEILKAAYDDAAVNFRDWGIQLGRRFRALKLWFVIRTYGVEGLRAMLREHIRLGKLFADWVDGEPGFERIGEAPLATVCFRLVPAGESELAGDLDRLNRDLLERLNATGKIFLTGTRLKGRYVLRLALGHLTTTEAHVREAWDLIRREASEL
ncbi:MAG TPA: pyridoxal-dependent decarboxylase [Gemmatimonadales bacterium]|nr:pyridoxal-dependent decarboxylase [Gemmatimonadales bacterium]